MRKYSPHISKFLLTLTLVFVVSGFVLPVVVSANHTQDPEAHDTTPCPAGQEYEWKAFEYFSGKGPCVKIDDANGILDGLIKIGGVTLDALLSPIGGLAILFMEISQFILWLSGVLLNHVVLFTIIDMSKNLNNTDAINIAWSTIRDLANMTFIFILLYAAIKTILGMGSDTKKLIIRVIVVAILINFSLFFTKVVIDASNILAITFYEAIAPDALTRDDVFNGGLSRVLSKPLSLGTIYDTTLDGESTGMEIWEGRKQIVVGVLGSIFFLVASFVFFAMSFMLIIRFVVLMFVLILSPIAFMAFVLPGLKSQGTRWREALFGQAFFAPIFFVLMWIVISLVNNILTSEGNLGTVLSGVGGQDGDMEGARLGASQVGVVMDFIIIIVFLVSALVIAKQWADKAGGAVANINKWAGKAAGGASFGLAGFAGRQTVGRVGNLVGESETLKRWARSDSATGRIAGRLGLAAGRKTAGASFDGRGTAIGVPLEAGKAQKGGYTQYRKTKDEREDKFAASLEASAKAKAESKKELSDAEKEHENAVKDYGENSSKAQESRERLTKARERYQEIHGNKEIIQNELSRLEERKKAEIEKVDEDSQSKLDSNKFNEERSLANISRLQAQVDAAGASATEAQLDELEYEKKALEDIRREARGLREVIENQKKKIVDNYEEQKGDFVKKTPKIDEGKITRRRAYANIVENSTWAKFSGYNYSGAAKIRTGIKTNKDKVVEALQALEKEGGTGSPSAEKTGKEEEKSEGENSNKKA